MKFQYESQILTELRRNLQTAKTLPDEADYKAERIERLGMIVRYQKNKIDRLVENE